MRPASTEGRASWRPYVKMIPVIATKKFWFSGRTYEPGGSYLIPDGDYDKIRDCVRKVSAAKAPETRNKMVHEEGVRRC
jgi:hypothetical protein